MWKPNFKHVLTFIAFLRKMPPSHYFLAASLYLLAFLYPGHNRLQTTPLHPGVVRGYVLSANLSFSYPQTDGVVVPPVSSHAVVIQDIESKTMIYSKNPDTLLLPASITKVMTALVALDHWNDLDTVIEVKNEDRAIGQTIELQKGEHITLKNILYGLLVHSGNDAALAIADNYPGGYVAFVTAMNQKAQSLHLDHTTFKNPSGVEQYGHVTTARDLAVLAAYAIQNPTILDMVQTKQVTITDITGSITHTLTTTNELLGKVAGLKGLKTGWTTNAGECLVSYVERDGHGVIIVVLGSRDRFGETAELIDWTYTHHNWITLNL